MAIKSCIRNQQDTAYRYGEEEFTVILPETTQDDSVMIAERIRISLESTLFQPNGDRFVTVSIGPSVEMRDFVKLTDAALYSSKENGRNQVSAATRNGKWISAIKGIETP